MASKRQELTVDITVLEHNSKCRLLLLPDNILLAIFQYLDSLSVVKLSMVSKRCYHLSFDKTLTRSIDLRLFPLRLKNLWEVFYKKLTSNTTSFHIRGTSQVRPVMVKLTIPYLEHLNKKCRNLRHLSLEFFDLRDIPLTKLNKDLISLSLKDSMLSMGWFDDLKSNFSMLNLKYLNLNDCSKLSNNDLQSLSYLKNVEKLILSNCFRISARGIPIITTHMKKLNYVDFSCCPGINNVVLHYLSKLPLEHVILRFCHLITSPGIGLLFSHDVGQTLKVFDLYSCHEVTDDSLDVIALNASCLCKLDLSGCNKLSATKLEELKERLPNCDVLFQLVGSTTECSETNYQACTRMSYV